MEIKHTSPDPPHQHCTGTNCDWAIDTSNGEEGLCLSGSGTCVDTYLLEADPSELHDKNLMAATQQIKHILAGIPADPNGRKLSFLVTDMGLLLAWVNHGKDIPANAVTAKDDNATVAKALKLKTRETV